MNSGTGPANAGPFLLRLGQIPETSLLQPVISLPVDSIIPDLLSALQQSNCLVLKAPAGAGKTTRVPPALLQSGLAGSGQIVMLEPRRLAARTAAARMAFEHGQKVGQQFGFRVRFEEAVSRETRVLTVTEGVLLRRLQDDPFLDDVTIVVFDEFHERRLDSDLALAMVRRVQQTVRPDLRIVVMSATLDPEPIARWLGDCPVVRSEGRLFPVRISWFSPQQRQSIPELAAVGVERVLQSAANGSESAQRTAPTVSPAGLCRRLGEPRPEQDIDLYPSRPDPGSRRPDASQLVDGSGPMRICR